MGLAHTSLKMSSGLPSGWLTVHLSDTFSSTARALSMTAAREGAGLVANLPVATSGISPLRD
ncbi:hypothetical protein FHT77_003384 [Rhizobium sp. BK181]|nr:hypothetical protein [Rhizobium sp. BK181]